MEKRLELGTFLRTNAGYLWKCPKCDYTNSYTADKCKCGSENHLKNHINSSLRYIIYKEYIGKVEEYLFRQKYGKLIWQKQKNKILFVLIIVFSYFTGFLIDSLFLSKNLCMPNMEIENIQDMSILAFIMLFINFAYKFGLGLFFLSMTSLICLFIHKTALIVIFNLMVLKNKIKITK